MRSPDVVFENFIYIILKMSITDTVKGKLVSVITQFKNLSTPKKFLILIVAAILVVVILSATGVISNDSVSPSTVYVPDDTTVRSTPTSIK